MFRHLSIFSLEPISKMAFIAESIAKKTRLRSSFSASYLALAKPPQLGLGLIHFFNPPNFLTTKAFLRGALLLLTLALPHRGFAVTPFTIATTSEDLKALILELAPQNKDIETNALVKPGKNPHDVLLQPSMFQSTKSADLLFLNGVGLEEHWITSLLKTTKNKQFESDPRRIVNLGSFVPVLDVTKRSESHSSHVENHESAGHGRHAQGNPHYLLDPIIVKNLCTTVSDQLTLFIKNENLNQTIRKSVGPCANKYQAIYEEGLKAFKDASVQIVTVHSSLDYFLRRFHLPLLGTVEPRPEESPTPQYLHGLIKKIKAAKNVVLLQEMDHPEPAVEKLKKEIPNLKIVILPVLVGSTPEIKTLEALQRYLILKISEVSHSTKAL